MPLDQRKYLVTVSFMQFFSMLFSTLYKTGVTSFFPLIQSCDAASWGVGFLFLSRNCLKRCSSCAPLISTLRHDLLLLSQCCVSQASLRLMGSCQAEGIRAAHSYGRWRNPSNTISENKAQQTLQQRRLNFCPWRGLAKS